MDEKELKQRMRKRNMKIFPIYKMIGWDYLFFYTLDFLFLTQVKNISAANVVLKSSFIALFSIIMQIPANIIVDLLERKRSIIIANFLNCFYIVILMLSKDLSDLILAAAISATAVCIKNIAEPSLLNESIPPSKYKSQIFAKINTKGASRFYILGAISKVIAGYLFTINGYIPMICCLITLIAVTVISTFFIEPVEKKKKRKKKDYLKSLNEITDGFSYVLKVDRLKALLLAASLISSLLVIFRDYSTSLLEDIGIASIAIGIISAVGDIIKAASSKRQEEFNSKFRNKSLSIIALNASISCLISGICGIEASSTVALLVIVILSRFTFDFAGGLYYTIIDRYLRNFTNKKIDTKIFAASNLASNVMAFIGGLFASFLLDKISTAYCMVILGLLYTIIYTLMSSYMKTRIGKKPMDYSKEETKYDELHLD